MVVHLLHTEQGVSSNLTVTTKTNALVAEWPNATDCKSVKPGVQIPPSAPSFVSVDVAKVQPRKLYERAERCPVRVSGTQVATITTYLCAIRGFKENIAEMVPNKWGGTTYKFIMELLV